MDEYLFRTIGTPEIKALVDASLDQRPSLADVEEFRVLANTMAQMMAYTMFLSSHVETWRLANFSASLEGPTQEETERALAETGPLLRPYEAYAIGACKDEDGAYVALALVHADDTSAEENVGLLRRRIEEGSSFLDNTPWSDYIDVDRLEINAEGRLLLAKLRGGIVPRWILWIYEGDPLILYE